MGRYILGCVLGCMLAVLIVAALHPGVLISFFIGMVLSPLTGIIFTRIK